MSTEIKVPVLPESVADATVALWHKKPGDSIRRDENLVDLETDKVVLEVPSPVNGVVSKILRDTGETVTSNELLGIIEEGEVEVATQPAASETQAVVTQAPETSADDTSKLSPAARRVAEEEKADVSRVTGTGRGGPSCVWRRSLGERAIGGKSTRWFLDSNTIRKSPAKPAQYAALYRPGGRR